MLDNLRTESFDYDLPEELIAQHPAPRGENRLLVIDRSTGIIADKAFRDLPDYLLPKDLLVVNDTRVSARRLIGTRPAGGPCELMLIAPAAEDTWTALVHPGRSLKPGKWIDVMSDDGTNVRVDILSSTPDGGRVVRFPDAATSYAAAHWGTTPLPPYIGHALESTEEERYQTVYGRYSGSAAAPTAGLHFTPELLSKIQQQGVRRCSVTLHVGVGTFRPVKCEHIRDHEMHSEAVSISEETSGLVNRCDGRVIAVGTTSVRALETAAARTDIGRVAPYTGPTSLFITPGYTFRAVDALITNFHQPKSTLLMMVSALAGIDLIREAYQRAISLKYRFFSFGDAMLIL